MPLCKKIVTAELTFLLEVRYFPRSHKGTIMVKLLLSIDRRQGKAEAEHALKIALETKAKHPDLVVGLDLSGDPTAGAFESFLPTLLKAKQSGLGVVLHCGEVNRNFYEKSRLCLILI